MMPSKPKFKPAERGGPKHVPATLADDLFTVMVEEEFNRRYCPTITSTYYGQPCVFNEAGVRVGWLFMVDGHLEPLYQPGVLVDGDLVLDCYRVAVDNAGFVRLHEAGPMPEVIHVGA